MTELIGLKRNSKVLLSFTLILALTFSIALARADPLTIPRETIERMTYADMAKPQARATIQAFFNQFDRQHPLQSPTEKELSALQVLRPSIHRSFITELRNKESVALTQDSVELNNVPGFRDGVYKFASLGVMVKASGNEKMLHFYNLQRQDGKTLGIASPNVEVVSGIEHCKEYDCVAIDQKEARV